MTNQNNLKSAIERLHEAEKIIKNVINEGELSTIDRDVFLEKLRETYENVLFFNNSFSENRVQQQVQTSENKKDTTPQPEVTIVDEPKTHPKEEPANSVKEENHVETEQPTPPVQEVQKAEPVEIEKELTLEEEPEEPATEQDFSQSKPSTEILGEKYQGKRKFRNESLAAGKKDVATKLQNKPVEDLSKSIGINDKFMYTKELFHGNAELYAKTIAKLNEFSDMNDAMFFIQENFSWDSKNEAANQLIELVRRKLMPGY